MRLKAFLLFFLLHLAAHSQVVIPGYRQTAWHLAGAPAGMVAPSNEVNIMDFFSGTLGETPANAAYAAALASLNGGAGTIKFPEGGHLFNATITVPDSVFLVGESPGAILMFEMPAQADLIRITGTLSNVPLSFSEGATRGSHTIVLDDASSLSAGDVIRLRMDDEDLVFSTWAYGTVGQVVEVVAIEGNTLTLADPLNTYYPLSRHPKAFRMDPVRAAGIECLKVWNMTSGNVQAANILMRHAFNCAVRNVRSHYGDFAHVDLRSSAHVTVEGCYFWLANAYGSGGQGYGTMVQEAASFNRIENNIFDRFRHSMIAQSGANGNVFAYNFSRDPYWTDVTLPANSAGDLVMHGNYPYMNLAEGNTVQHIVVDASHGNNGPMNTFFRNRAQLYGFFSDSGTPTDSMNLIGNETTNTGLFMGNFIVNGAGHLNHGNNVRGTLTPAGTQNIGIESLLYADGNLPTYMGGTLPMIGYPNAMNANTTPAQVRYDSGSPGNYVSCEEEVVTAVPVEAEVHPLPALHGDRLSVPNALLPAQLAVYGMDGRLLFEQHLTETSTVLGGLPSGIHVFRLAAADGRVLRWKGAVGNMK